MASIKSMAPGLLGLATGFAASLCCVLPLAIVALGLGSGGFMLVTMQFRPVLYPIGLLGLLAAFYLFFRRKRACDRQACRMQHKWLNAALLALSTVLMAAITYVDFFLEAL